MRCARRSGPVLAAMLVSGCATLPLDRSTERGWRDDGVDVAEVPRYGSQVEVVMPRSRSRGELIAVARADVWMLVGELGELRRVPRVQIQWIDVEHGPRVRGGQIDQLYQFARFPQGLPGGQRGRLLPAAPSPSDPHGPEGEPHDPYDLDDDDLRGPGTEPTPIPTTM